MGLFPAYEYNAKFGKEARNSEDANRPMRENDDLERIFARKAIRKLSKSLSFQYGGNIYQIQPMMKHRQRATHVDILERPGKPILIRREGQEVPYTKWESQEHKPKVLDVKELEAYWPTKERRKPGKHHPWK